MPIYRGSGGSGNSNTSANANQVAIDAAAAAQSAIDAAASAAAALVSENEAESAETNAETSETNAATSATNAGTSETNAATSATNAGTSETNAATSATNAGTSETNAATSASNASTSETNAASSASTATTKAAEASTSATNASNSAIASDSSATDSANSATASAASATASAASAAAAQAAQEAIDGLYLGAQASDPTVDLNGDPVTVGDWYFNTTINKSKIYNGSGWDVLTADGSVTSVTGTGTVSGLTLTGTVTTAGNLTLGGALSGITASQLSSQNISQWTNDSGYTTNTGTVTPSSTDTFTNKSGNISQWTNDSGYITSYTEADTLDTVTGRGATTANAVTVGNLTSTGIDDNATSTAITIDSDERVGINITPMNRTFEVKSIADAQIIASFETGSSVAGRIAIADANTTADSSVGIGSTGDNLNLYAGAAAKATLSSAGNLSVTGNLTSLGIDDNATSTALTINSSQNTTFAGAVTATSAVLEGTSDSILTLRSTDDGPLYMEFERGTDRHAYLGFGGSNDVFKINNEETAGTIEFLTANTSAVTIDASQNVILSGEYLELSNGGRLQVSIASPENADLTGGSTNGTDSDGLFAFYGGLSYNTGAGIVLNGADHATLPNVTRFVNGAFTERARINADGTTDFLADVFTTGDFVAGKNSGSIAMTVNDGYGNANIAFNHQNGVPDQDGNALRIECNTDATTAAYIHFEGLSGVTSGVATALTDMARMYADTGDFHANGNVVSYSTTISDERLKENVEQVTGALDMLDQIRGVTFDRIDTGKKSAGVIAQELEQVMPYAIYETALPLKTGSEEDVYKLVEYDALHAVLIEAIKELRAEVEALKNGSS